MNVAGNGVSLSIQIRENGTHWKKSSLHLRTPIGLPDSFPAFNQRDYVHVASESRDPPINEVTMVRFL